jgi:hypothetical protein
VEEILFIRHLYEDCWNGKWKCSLIDLIQWFNISTIFFLFLLEKIQQTKVKLVFSLLMLIELKLISTLLMPQPICEGCLVTLIKLYLQFFYVFYIIVLIGLSF